MWDEEPHESNYGQILESCDDIQLFKHAGLGILEAIFIAPGMTIFITLDKTDGEADKASNDKKDEH